MESIFITSKTYCSVECFSCTDDYGSGDGDGANGDYSDGT